MKAGTLLLVAADVIGVMESKGLLNAATGDFGDFGNVTSDIAFATAVEQVLVKHGVNVPGNVQKVINLINTVSALLV